MLTSILIITLLLTHGYSISSSEYYLQQLDRAAYSGDVSKVIKVVELQLDWNQLYNDRKSPFTAIHHALEEDMTVLQPSHFSYLEIMRYNLVAIVIIIL